MKKASKKKAKKCTVMGDDTVCHIALHTLTLEQAEKLHHWLGRWIMFQKSVEPVKKARKG